MNVGINYSSLEKICASSNQVMIYGWKHTGYDKIVNQLQKPNTKYQTSIRKCFDWKLGKNYLNEEDLMTYDYRIIEQIKQPVVLTPDHVAKSCKTALVNLVLENCKRAKEHLPLIPLVFCVDAGNNPHPFSIESIASRKPVENTRITNKELRRIYKLCHFADDFIADIACKTVKFVKVHINSNNQYQFEEKAPFWSDPSWKNLWQERQNSKSAQKQNTSSWALQLTSRLSSNPTPQNDVTFYSDTPIDLSFIEMETTQPHPTTVTPQVKSPPISSDKLASEEKVAPSDNVKNSRFSMPGLAVLTTALAASYIAFFILFGLI